MPRSYHVLCLATLLLIVEAVFLLERGQTQTDATERLTHAGGYTAGAGNE